MAEFYTIEKRCNSWGDYYNILMHGMSCHRDRNGGLIQLERTGPFVPPISIPGISDIIVTDVFRRKLELSDLKGLRFQPVIKKLIVHSKWHTWDRDAEEPAKYPRSGEPENYILGHRHSAVDSEQMGVLWELLLTENARVYRARDDIYLLMDSWQGEDLFHAQGVGYIYATKRAKCWLEEHAGDYVMFQEAKTKDSS